MISEHFWALNITSEQNSGSFWKIYSRANFTLHDSVEVSRIHVNQFVCHGGFRRRVVGQGCCLYDCKQLAKLSELNTEKKMETAE